MGEVWESVLGVAESEKRCVEEREKRCGKVVWVWQKVKRDVWKNVKKGVGKCIGVQGK